MSSRSGTSLIDFLLSIAIISLLFVGVYSLYWSMAASVQNVGARNAAVAVLQNEVEIVRNIPYANVGTAGGIPAGVIPQVQTVAMGSYFFTVNTTVLNIDDPFDAAPSSSPVADYKLVTFTASCALCRNFDPVSLTTTASSNNLTSGTSYGSVFVYAIDANGNPVAGANVQVVNASVTPSINFTDTTNASGALKLIGVPTSTQGYQIFISKPGYSSAQTYPPGGAGNPNPVSPNVTVTAQTVSDVTLAIDQVSTLGITTVTNRCVAVPSEPFSIQGSRLIGTSPDVPNFSTSSQTNAGGAAALVNLPWDTYALTLTDAGEATVGTVPLDPVAVNPSSTQSFMFVLQPAANPSLLVNVIDGNTGNGIPGAAVTISKGAFSGTLTTDHATLNQSDWSGGQYVSISGINTATPGQISMIANASDTYATGAPSSLISTTFDVGGTSSTFNSISWAPVNEPTSTGAAALEFQVAGNTDNATWNFIGPDGTAATYFASSSIALPASLAGDRYFRYEAFLQTEDPDTSPTLTGVTVDFTANCVPPAQAFFASLSAGNYLIDVTANGYSETTSTITVSSGEASTTVML